MYSLLAFHRFRLVAPALAVVLAGSLTPLMDSPAHANTPQSCAAKPGDPVPNPLPGVPPVGTLGVTLSLLARLPQSKPGDKVLPPSREPIAPGYARINYVGGLPDGRLYAPDLNGKMYLIDKGKPVEYLDIERKFPDFQKAPGLGTGFAFVAFHPGFATNRKFYTVHTEAGRALRKTPSLLEEKNTTEQHSVITEWTANTTTDKTFQGTSREVLRIAFSAHKHAIQQIGFNPNAKPLDKDYGKLYIALGDGENDDYLSPEWTNVAQDLSRPQGKILRIDPTPQGGKPYTVPPDNPFVKRAGALGEIYAYGMRDPHRFSWDTDNKMYLGHFGEHRVESVYQVESGDNFGWNKREGGYYFNGKKLDQWNVYKLPAGGEQGCDYTYPVASYGHDVNNDMAIGNVVGISGGFVYRGKIPALRGMYVFGDVISGKVFYAKAAEMTRGAKGVVPRQAPLHQLKLYDTGKQVVTMSKLATGKEKQRVDFRIGVADNELYFLTKADGGIWQVGAPPV